MNRHKIIERLKKLIRHEQSARAAGSVGEADNFKEKIEALRLKHGITEEIHLEEEELNFAGELVFQQHSKHFKKKRVFWEEYLFGNLCAFFNCHPIVFKKGNLKAVVGEKADRANVIKAYLHLTELAKGKSQSYLVERLKSEDLKPTERRTIKESFCHGFAHGIALRFQGYRSEKTFVENYRKNNQPETDLSPSLDAPSLEAPSMEAPQLTPPDVIALHKENKEESRKKEFAEEISKLGKPKEPSIKAIDVEAFFSGQEFARKCALTDEIALEEKRVYEAAQEIREEIRRTVQENMRRRSAEGMFTHDSNVFYNRNRYRAWTPRQIDIIFNDND